MFQLTIGQTQTSHCGLTVPPKVSYSVAFFVQENDTFVRHSRLSLRSS